MNKNNKKNSNFILGSINNKINSGVFNKNKNYNEKYLNLPKYIENHYAEINKANQKLLKIEKTNLKQIIILYACHTSNNIKQRTFDSNLNFLRMIPNSELVIINTISLPNSKILQQKYQSYCKKYFLIPNNKLLDFGKWQYALQNVQLEEYDYVVFINDSIIIEKPIHFFFSILSSKNVDYYGYNNSTQTKFHSQSYLFSIKTNQIYRFIELIERNLKNITSNPESVVYNLELKLLDEFKNHKHFLNTRKFPDHSGKNIFFNNDYLYLNLKKAGLFPFTKVKRILH